MLTAGFETYPGMSWSSFAADNASAAEFILMGFRLVGALNVALGLLLLAIALTAYRHPRTLGAVDLGVAWNMTLSIASCLSLPSSSVFICVASIAGRPSATR